MRSAWAMPKPFKTPDEQTAMDRLRETAVLAQAERISGELMAVLFSRCDEFPVAMSALEIACASALWTVRPNMEADLGRPIEDADLEELAGNVRDRVLAHLRATLKKRREEELEALRLKGRAEIINRLKGAT